MLIDPKEFECGFLRWDTAGVHHERRRKRDAPPQIAVDGKALRRSFEPPARKDAAASGQRVRDLERLRAGAAARGREGWRARSAAGPAGRPGGARRLDQPGRRGLPAGRGRGDRLARRRLSDRAQGQRRRFARRGKSLVRRACLRDRRRATSRLGHDGRAPRPARAAPGVCCRRGPRCPPRWTCSPPGPALRRVVAVETKRLVENPAPGAPRGREPRGAVLPHQLDRPRGAHRRGGARPLGHREPPALGARHRVRARTCRACGIGMPRPTSLCCAASRSTWCGADSSTTPAASRASARWPAGTTPSCTASSPT